MAGFSVSRDGTTTSPIALALQNFMLREEASVERQATAVQHPPLRFAIGGFPILRGGKPVHGLDDSARAVRTSAGYGPGGHLFYLVALDGDSHARSRLTLRELAGLMQKIGSQDAVDLDGGGSSTLVVRNPGSTHVSVRNHPIGGSERPVADGVGIFVHR
ncbi:MAG: phosphodiester glycosidase family protein [Streptomycetaceae bacterium]|nr:phosphodiester glycosidase family protein [Streptomycetaceae bacterium]